MPQFSASFIHGNLKNWVQRTFVRIKPFDFVISEILCLAEMKANTRED